VLAVGDRHASGLLTAVLEGVEAVEDQVRHCPFWRVDREHPTGFLHGANSRWRGCVEATNTGEK